jgi:hypothetical protein
MEKDSYKVLVFALQIYGRKGMTDAPVQHAEPAPACPELTSRSPFEPGHDSVQIP